MGRVQYDKLIRDNIPEKIEAAGDAYETKTLADDADFAEALRKKVLEEATELSQAETREDFLKEYADLMITLDALTYLQEYSPADIKMAIEENLKKKGGFTKRLFLLWSDHT